LRAKVEAGFNAQFGGDLKLRVQHIKNVLTNGDKNE